MKGAIAWWLLGVWMALAAAALTPEAGKWDTLPCTTDDECENGPPPQDWVPVRKLA